MLTGHGGPEVLEVQERPDPQVGPGEVRIAVKAAGLNFADTAARVGLYPDAPKPPCVLGYEVAGEVESVGEGASGAEIRAQLWTRDGPASAPLTVASTSVERASGFPRMALAGRALLFAWTDTSATPIVRTALLELR